MVTRCKANRTDDGGVLILTLILVVVLAAVVLALASFVTVGLKASDVASERTETNADSSSVMNWAIEEFAKKQLRPDDSCGDAPSYLAIAVPVGLMSNGSTTTLQCAQTDAIAGEPVVHLIAQSTGDQVRVVEATVEVPLYTHGARIADWRVDIPIAVPAYVTTTTTATGTTTTTLPNAAPHAPDMTVSVGLDDGVFTFLLPATDPETDPMSISSLTPSGTEVVATAGAGINVGVSAVSIGGASVGSTYSFTYEVSDTEPKISNVGTVVVVVVATGTPPSTSTTTPTPPLAPMPTCVFQVTFAAGDNKSGIGRLSVSNNGGDFTGWQLGISWPGSWAGTWDSSVTASGGSPTNTMSGVQTIANGVTLNFNVDLTWTGGNPKIVSGSTRTCTMISPP